MKAFNKESFEAFIASQDSFIYNESWSTAQDEAQEVFERFLDWLGEPKAQELVPNEEELRAEFVRQHKGRNLLQHPLRGTYSSQPIAALWNQHKRTAEWMATRLRALLSGESR